MKKYLQACELGGSIYGKRRVGTRSRGSNKTSNKRKTDFLNEYDSFYKNQLNLMSRIFRRVR